tara:strand:- start:1674 stop:2087 length:414 start_codon:yes stop_codon:yes gene_type:complete
MKSTTNKSETKPEASQREMNIKDMTIQIDETIYLVGRIDDGSEYTAEAYNVEVILPNGRRFQHNVDFFTSKIEYNEFGEACATDEREEKRAQVEGLADRIREAGVINLDHWTEGQPVYGSSAYVGQGGDSAFLTQYD